MKAIIFIALLIPFGAYANELMAVAKDTVEQQCQAIGVDDFTECGLISKKAQPEEYANFCNLVGLAVEGQQPDESMKPVVFFCLRWLADEKQQDD